MQQIPEERLVTNAEVMSILNKKIKRNIDLTPFEYFVYCQHENQTASPLYRKRRLLKLSEYLKQFEFTSQQNVIIANYPPTNIVEFYSVFPNPQDYDDERINQIIEEINEIMNMELSDDENEMKQQKPKKHFRKGGYKGKKGKKMEIEDNDE